MTDDTRLSPPGRLVVLQSFPTPRETTNPYITMLARSLAAVDDLDIRTFTWREALLRSHDVFHAHWPEVLVSGHSPLKKLVRQLLFAVLLLKLTMNRTAIVRTVHNLDLPRGISRRESLLLRLAERMTTLRIAINTTTVLPEGHEKVVIRHGHYQDWFSTFDKPAPVDGRLAYFGLIRRYKGVSTLVRAFRQVTDPTLSLRVGGRPSTTALADELRADASGDPRISLHLEFLSDAELVELVSLSQLVVLPYREMHNSGGTLAALSLGRPVLIPDNTVNRLLRDEVGAPWVHLYAGELDGPSLERTLDRVRRQLPEVPPDLHLRSWTTSGRDHLAAYRRAVVLRRGPDAIQA